MEYSCIPDESHASRDWGAMHQTWIHLLRCLIRRTNETLCVLGWHYMTESRITWETGLSACLWNIIGMGRPAHYGWHHSLVRIVGGTNGERELSSSSIHYFLLPDCRCHVTSCFKLLLPVFVPQQTVSWIESRINLSSQVVFIWVLIIVIGKND